MWISEPTPKIHMYNKDWTACSKHATHSKFNSEHDWGDMYDHLITTRAFTLIMKKKCM